MSDSDQINKITQTSITIDNKKQSKQKLYQNLRLKQKNEMIFLKQRQQNELSALKQTHLNEKALYAPKPRVKNNNPEDILVQKSSKSVSFKVNPKDTVDREDRTSSSTPSSDSE